MLKLTNDKHFYRLNSINVIRINPTTFFVEMRQILVNQFLSNKKKNLFNCSKEHLNLMWNGLMQSDECKW